MYYLKPRLMWDSLGDKVGGLPTSTIDIVIGNWESADTNRVVLHREFTGLSLKETEEQLQAELKKYFSATMLNDIKER